MSWPSAIGGRSTSIGAPAAIVEASGFIFEISGHTVAAAPTAAAAPVAMKRKSRRVEPAEDAVVTFPNPFPSCSRWNHPRARLIMTRGGCRRPRPPRRQHTTALLHQLWRNKAIQNRSIGTLAVIAQA